MLALTRQMLVRLVLVLTGVTVLAVTLLFLHFYNRVDAAGYVDHAGCEDCSKMLRRDLQQYANPAICPMVLCRGSCAGADNACSALSGCTVLDPEHLGHFMVERNCHMATEH